MILGSNMEGYYQQVRGLQYYYITKGHGKQDVIFLHGFLGSHAIFLEGLLETDLIDTHRLILMDLLGHGATEGAELHYRFSAKEQVADLAYFITHHCQKPVILCGYSMGARLALSLAIQHPNLCRGLVLESGHFGICTETERQSRQSLDAQRADQIKSDYSSFLRYWEDISLFNSPNARMLNSAYRDIQKTQQPIWITNSLLGFGAGTMPCLENRLTRLRMPVLLLVGEDDSKFIAINQRMHLMLPSSYLSIVNGAGHRVHWDAPKAWQKEIELFISLL